MLTAILCALFVLLVLGAAIFLHQGGILWCEDGHMMKLCMGSFALLYIVAVVSLKLLLPGLPSDQIAMESVTGVWTTQWNGIGVHAELPPVFSQLLTSNTGF